MTIIPFLLLLILLRVNSVPDSVPFLRANSTIQSYPNGTFTLGFFSPNNNPLSNYYLGIWYSALPITTAVWVANRRVPLKDLSSAALSLTTSSATLSLSDAVNFVVWRSDNSLPASRLLLLDSGNLVLYASDNSTVVWQSFHSPSDTWLPGMNLTATTYFTCWTSLWDPSPGRYSLRLRPPLYGEIELVYNNTDFVRNSGGSGRVVTTSYWSTGNWTGTSFANVPEMTVPYIYRFYFDSPFNETASFGFNEVGVGESGPPLTRFHVEYTGEVRQYTWSPQTEYWNMFWARPEPRCRAYGLCGPNGLCYEGSLEVCGCPVGFEPVDGFGWGGGDFSAGCKRKGGCDDKSDGFVEVGVVSFDVEKITAVVQGVGSRGECEKGCLGDCGCVGVVYNERNNFCKYVFGELMNLRNSSGGSTMIMNNEMLYLRVGRNGLVRKSKLLSYKEVLLIGAICGVVGISIVMCLILLLVRRVLSKRRDEEEDATLAATHLRVYTYKELQAATRGFSEKLGHGGFGTVFQGALPPDSAHVAVKRLERPGNGGEKEFRAEVCTIGNVQHMNLVRLRGFCSENSHRLLVYDYMPNGPLSGYLKKDGQNMSWEVRFRVAIGTARALAYLHEECRDCILHCDIKPENILLDWDYTAKVSDFGLAKLIGRDFSRVLATMRGTWGYVAPEWISGVAITTKADVYSYGMTMLELIGGRRNVEAPPPSPPPNNANALRETDGASADDADNANKWFFPPWAARQIIQGNLGDIVDARLGVAYDRLEAERLGMVAVWCIQDNEEARPSMGMVVKMLEGVVEVSVPPPPKLLQALVSGESFAGLGADVDSSNLVSTVGGVCSGDNLRVSVDSVSSQSPGIAPPLPTNRSV